MLGLMFARVLLSGQAASRSAFRTDGCETRDAHNKGSQEFNATAISSSPVAWPPSLTRGCGDRRDRTAGWARHAPPRLLPHAGCQLQLGVPALDSS